MGFIDFFIVALIPILKTLIISGIGLLLALQRVNILSDIARHHLNNLVYFVFSPAIVGSSLADTITMSSLIKLWFMPVNILLTFMIGSALGWILVRIIRTPQHLHGLVIGCCAAGNLGIFPLIIIPAVCKDTNSPFGDSSTCFRNGEDYASLSMAVGVVFLWSYIYNIIRAYGTRSIDSTMSINKCIQGSEILQESIEEALLSKDCERNNEIYQAQDKLPLSLNEDNAKVPFQKKIKKQLKILVANMNLQMLFAPSTIAAIVGLLIDVISPLRKILIGDNAALRVIYSSASMLGAICFIATEMQQYQP